MTQNTSAFKKTSAVAAYYHIPAIWVGGMPSYEELKIKNSATLTKEVYSKLLSCGIRVRVRRDGLFVFDFSEWEPGESVSIPVLDNEHGRKRPPKVIQAEEKAELHIYRRVQAMNVHLACLNSAISLCEKKALPINQVITPSEYLAMANFDDDSNISGLKPFWSPIHSYILSTGGLQRNISTRYHRRELTLESIDKSFEIFDSVISSKIKGITTVINLIYISAKSYSDHDFSNALVLSWTACENLINTIWEQFIENYGLNLDKKLKDKLSGIEYTASITLDVLYLLNMVPLDLYEELNISRKARNRWLHNLGHVSERESASSLRAAKSLLKNVTGIRLDLTVSRFIHYVTSESEVDRNKYFLI